jgi:beta-lactamase regulating signal transducer with metallopeptidase domain
MEELSQDEFEAVVAHEFEHLRWKDPLLKIFCSSISTLCWWIPTIWWLKKLEIDQEEASDSGLGKYGIDSVFLASAIIKVLEKAKSLKMTYDLAPTCSLHSSKSNIKRFEALLNSDHKAQSPFFRWAEAIGCLLCSLAFICFWMC